MTLSLQEISDRLEIHDLLVAYCHAIDTRDWDALDALFTPDAVIDYSATGGPVGTLAEQKAFLREVMPMFTGFQHLAATSKVTIRGDEAEGRTICHNPMTMEVDGEPWTFFCGLWYVDRFVRTVDGWRIASRAEDLGYFHHLPPALRGLGTRR